MEVIGEQTVLRAGKCNGSNNLLLVKCLLILKNTIRIYLSVITHIIIFQCLFFGEMICLQF